MKSYSRSFFSGFILLFMLLVASQAQAQKIKKFSSGKEPYLAELQQFLKDITTSKEKEKTEALYLEVNGAISGGEITDKEFAALVDVSNNLLRKRVVEYEVWQALYRALIIIHQNEDPQYALPWIENLAEFTRKSKGKDIREYVVIMYLCLNEQTLFDDGNLRWTAAEAIWSFSYEGEPQFTISDANLWGHFKTDSTLLEGINGTYFPLRQQFVGEGGKIYWTRTGISADSLYAEFSRVRITTNKANFIADSVTIHSKLYINQPLVGRLEERLSAKSTAKSASFPRFTSYNQDIQLASIYNNVDFVGGISIIGKKFYGSGTPEKKATLLFLYEGKPIVKAQSERILLREDLLTSENTQITIRVDEDSIYHPKLALKFIPAQNQLTFNRDREGISQAPFSDSYHNLDIYFDMISWNMVQPQMHLGNLNMGAESPVIFESENYYRGERMQQIKGLDDDGPLVNIAKVANLYGRKIMSLDEMAQGLRMSKEATHRVMLQMSVLGFVNYDLATENITVKEKLFQYIQNEKGRRDYDVIRFVSRLTSGANASISLLNFDMDIRGINAIALSDSQQVALFPSGRQITVHEGMDFDFDGRITAGRFSFWGRKFFFDYDLFQMNMATIDSMRFKVPSFTPDVNGNYRLVDVKNVLQDINGELLIDKPNNKSGRISYTEYPIFRSGKESYVYYDRADIFDSVYNRDNFFVELEPFEIDSLDIASTDGLKFAGTLTSAGIFPDMDEDIMVQEDYSLGFKSGTPEGGFPAYGGKGNYKGSINLSNRGFLGDGDIAYLTSTTVADSLIFFPDSTNGIANQYEIAEQQTGVEYPHVTANNVRINWRPYDDVFFTHSIATPFNMYDDIGMEARGTLALAPNELGGSGMLDFLDAQTESGDYLFENREFSSDTMAFRVRATASAPWGFELGNARGFVNFDDEKGEFTVNDSANYLSFPINQYIAFMDFAEWQIPDKTVEVQKLGGAANSHMVSVHPKQDSLQFMAGSAKFSLVASLLEGYDIPLIDVADASIIPDTGYVAIDSGAAMRTLMKSTILANRDSQFHEFYESSTDIKSRNMYRASGFKEYIDEDETPWPLYFATIKPDTSGTTIGKATVTEEDGFYLSAFFAYYGKVELRADVQNMTFNGYTLIQHTCPNIQTTWFKFMSEIDPKQIVIDLPKDNPSTRADNLYNGIYLAPDSTSGYSAFLSRENSKADREIISATGVLYYDKEISSYVVTTPDRVDNPKASGNWLALNNRDCYTTGKGTVAFADEAGRVSTKTYGVVTHDLESDAILLDTYLAMDFHFNKDVLEVLAAAFQGASSLKGADISREAYQIALNNTLTEKERKKFDEDVELYGAPDKLPKSMRNTLTFSEMIFEYNPDTRSFVSMGDVGITSILEEQINKKVFGIVEVAKKRRGDEFYIYLEVSESEYYYFQYKRNIMQFYCTDKEIMAKLLEDDDRNLKAEDGKPPYVYNAASRGKVRLFLQRFEE